MRSGEAPPNSRLGLARGLEALTFDFDLRLAVLV